MSQAPHFYADAQSWADAVVQQFLAYRSTCNGPDELLVADVDDTLIDSSSRWYEDYEQLAVKKGVDGSRLASLEEFRIKGPRVCVTELQLVNDYPRYKEARLHDTTFHIGMIALKDAAKVLARFRRKNLPGAYLSTRPAILGAVTSQNLRQLGFAPSPLLLRPTHIAYADTVAFKINAVLTLRQTLDNADVLEAGIRYIDDYLAVIEAIQALGHKKLVGIHFGAHIFWHDLVLL